MRFTLDSIYRDCEHPSYDEKRPLTVCFTTVQPEPENIYCFNVAWKNLKTFKLFRGAVIDAFAIWLDDPLASYQQWEKLVAAAFETGRDTQRRKAEFAKCLDAARKRGQA